MERHFERKETTFETALCIPHSMRCARAWVNQDVAILPQRHSLRITRPLSLRYTLHGWLLPTSPSVQREGEADYGDVGYEAKRGLKGKPVVPRLLPF